MSMDIVPIERINQAIVRLRGCNAMLDRDLAALYGRLGSGNLCILPVAIDNRARSLILPVRIRTKEK